MTDLFGGYKSQTTKGLQTIQSSKYPDTNKDFEKNLQRLNQFVDYIAQYLQTMQKGVDKANEDPITKLRSTVLDMGSLLGGGELLYGINLGDLQYFLPALGAMFGFDASQPFPLNLLYAAEHFFLGFVVPLDAWAPAVIDIIKGWATALGLSPEFMQAVEDLLNNMGRFTNDLMSIFNDVSGMLGFLNIMDSATPIGSLWHNLTQLLSQFNFTNLGHIVDPFLETLTPWIELLAQVIGAVDDMLEGVTGGLGGGTGTLLNPQNWINDFLGVVGLGPSSGLGSGVSNVVFSAIESIPIFGKFAGPFLQSITGSSTTGGGGVDGLFNVFSDFMGIFGNIGGLGTGTTAPDSILNNIPFLKPVFDQFVTMFDPLSSLTGFGGLQSIVRDFMGMFNLAGLGTGSPIISIIDHLPIFGPLIEHVTGGNLTGSAATISNLGSFFNFGPGTTNILSIMTNFASLVESFIPGMSGGTQTDFTNIVQNILSMLGNPSGLSTGTSGFNPISAIQQFAQLVGVPAGLLSSSSWVPVHTLGSLNAGAGVQTNALADADPGFSDASRFLGNTVFTLDMTLDHTGTVGSGSAKYMADGNLARLVSVPVAVKAGANITLASYTHWSGIIATTGNAIRLSVNAYDKNDILISNQVVSAISSPPASSIGYSGTDAINPSNLLSADTNGWVHLSGSAVTPTGTVYVCLCAEVGAYATAGQVNFDDVALYLPGIVDAGLLHNFESMAQGAIPGVAMEGFQALPDIFGSLTHLFDGLGSAASLISQSGLSFSNLFGLFQNSTVDTNNALSQAIVNTNVLNFRQNQPSAAGANLTTEAMIPLPHFGSGGTLTTTAVAAGTSILQKFNPAAVAKKGFAEFLGSLPASTSGGVFMNLFKWTGSAWSAVWNSADLTSLIPTAITDVTRVLIPGSAQPTMNAGEQYLIELVNNTAAALTVVARDTGIPNNSSETIPNMGASRTLSGTGGATPTSLANTNVSYSGKVPYFGLGILNVPASYVPPTTDTYDTPGAGTWTIPTWARVAGAIVDVIALGPGGGGQANYGALIWFTGGNAGGWAMQRLVCGVDYPVGATTISYVVGTKGLAAGAYWTNGHKGTDTTITWNDGTTNHTIVGAAGDGGGNGSTSGTNGKSPGNQIFHNQMYPGGGEVGGNANGSPFGGGGGGAGPYQTGGDGAGGKVWFKAAQSA